MKRPVLLMLYWILSAVATVRAADYRIELSTSAEGMTADYQLPAAVTEFRFDPVANPIRAQSWIVATPGLSLDAGVVRSVTGARFDRFTILIAPDLGAIDRVYPALKRVGALGYLVHTPHLRADTDDEPVISARRTVGVVAIANGKVDPKRLPADRYIYVGPNEYVSERSSYRIVSPPTIPQWLRLQIVDVFERTAGEYALRLGTRLPSKPLVILSYLDREPGDTESGASWRAETTPGYTLSLRFTGQQWQTRSAALVGIVETVVGHEVFHFWNSEVLSSSVTPTQPWLHEGSADYAALLMASSRDGAGFAAQLEQKLNECQSTLRDRALNGPAGVRGSAPYACGTVLFWVADVASGAGARGAGFFDLWHGLFVSRGGRNRSYDVPDVLASIAKQSDGALAAFELILNDGHETRWTQLLQRLQGLGLSIDRRVSDAALRAQLLQHLLELNCPESRQHGIYARADFLELDSDPVCAALPRGRRVTTVNGYNVLTQTRSAFDTASRQCALGQSVTLGDGTDDLTAPCTRPLNEPVPEFRVRSAEPALQR